MGTFFKHVILTISTYECITFVKKKSIIFLSVKVTEKSKRFYIRSENAATP